MKRILLSVILIKLAITLALPVTAFSQESMLPVDPIYIDNQPINTKYMMRDGHILVPAIFLKHTGVRVNWNEQYRSVVFSYGQELFALPIGRDYYDNYDPVSGRWERKTLATKSLEFDGEAFVPLVDVAREFGMSIHYNSTLRKTFISTKIPPAQNVIRRGNPQQKLVALTFDDGPDDIYTPQILDILKEKNVKATFFVLGRQVDAFPAIMQRIVNEGHGIANHTRTHPNLTKVKTSELIEEVRATQQIMQRTVGRAPDIFRPPFGALTKSDTLVLNQMGIRVVMWTVDTLDWSGLSGDEILAIVKRDITPGGIVLQHNFQSRARLLDGTVEALPKIIDELRAEGYQFVTVQTMLNRAQ